MRVRVQNAVGAHGSPRAGIRTFQNRPEVAPRGLGFVKAETGATGRGKTTRFRVPETSTSMMQSISTYLSPSRPDFGQSPLALAHTAHSGKTAAGYFRTVLLARQVRRPQRRLLTTTQCSARRADTQAALIRSLPLSTGLVHPGERQYGLQCDRFCASVRCTSTRTRSSQDAGAFHR